MLWLAEQGYDVTGVELSPLAAEAFFKEQGMAHFKTEKDMGLTYQAQALSLRIVCGDFFVFDAPPFDALYDRAALIALPQEQRAPYTDRCCRLLADGAAILLATLEYDQRQMEGPPYSVPEAAVASLWADGLKLVWSEELIDKEPRFQKKGLNSFVEKTWLGGCEDRAEKSAQIGFSDKS
jgi:thiopurine S-methyltransferase